MQSGWFFQVPPYRALHPVFARAAPAGPRGWLRYMRGERGRLRARAILRGPFATPHAALQQGEARANGIGTADESGTEHPRWSLQTCLRTAEPGLPPALQGH